MQLNIVLHKYVFHFFPLFMSWQHQREVISDNTSSYHKLFLTHNLLLNFIGFIAKYALNFSHIYPISPDSFRSSSNEKYHSFPAVYSPLHSCLPPMVSAEISLPKYNSQHITPAFKTLQYFWFAQRIKLEDRMKVIALEKLI